MLTLQFNDSISPKQKKRVIQIHITATTKRDRF